MRLGDLLPVGVEHLLDRLLRLDDRAQRLELGHDLVVSDVPAAGRARARRRAVDRFDAKNLAPRLHHSIDLRHSL